MYEGISRPWWRRCLRAVGDTLFPERQIHLRTNGKIRFFRFSRFGQVTVAGFVAGATAWASYATLSYVRHDDVVAGKDHEIASARFAYRSLLGEVATYQKKFSTITDELEDNHTLMLGLVEKNTSLQRSLSSVEMQLRTTEDARVQVSGARQQLKSRMSELETDMNALSTKNYTLKGNLDSVALDLQRALHERDLSRTDGKQLRRQIESLENRMEQRVAALQQRLSNLQTAQQGAIQRLDARAVAYIESVERVVEITGLKIDRLLAETRTDGAAQGGPFIPAKPDGAPGDQLKANLDDLDNRLTHLEALQTVMGRIPLTAPLSNYRVTSSYGKRRDPINKKWAAHYGVDLGGITRTPVYATAPGVVKKAGWKGRFGRYVEIDHGSGLITRYGHLKSIKVKRGQKVAFHQTVGLLGSSGRSTGPHVHYEVVFKGKPLNPMNFIKAGRYVFQK